MKPMPLIAAIIAAATIAAAQPTSTKLLNDSRRHQRFLEGYPPDATAVPGLPGAMTYPDVPEGYVLVHGDIQVRKEEYLNWLANGATVGLVDYWGLTVPYSFGPGLDNTQIQQAHAAMDAISDISGVTFVLRTNQSDWIHFNLSTGNNSPIGRQGGSQTINIHDWLTFIIAHEIFHSLGFWHEQSRFDRNAYVTIHLENVCQTCCDGSCNSNFAITQAGTYGPYDFDSVMHYPRDGFSVNGQDTIAVNPPWNAQWQDAIGQRDHLSAMDAVTCRGIYPESLDRWWKPGAGGNGSGTLPNPFAHATFTAAYNAAPAGGVLFIKDNATYPAVRTYSKAMTIRAPLGATLGN